MSTGPGAEPPSQDRQELKEWEWEDGGLFTRDLEGRLIRYDRATRDQLDTQITLTIDGEPVTVSKAVVATDEQGNYKYDDDGEVIPRPTTIFDAVTIRYENVRSDVSEAGLPSADENAFQKIAREGKNPIPVLCHTMYMDPVAVCRVCVVQLARLKKSTGKVEVDGKLLPACQHRVEAGMIVNTIASPDAAARRRIEGPVKTLVELLMTDHPSPCAKQVRSGDCELEALSGRMTANPPRFDRRPISAGEVQGRILAGHRRRPQRLHPLRPLRAGLQRDQGEPRHRPHGQGVRGADRIRPRCADGGLVLRGVRRVHGLLSDRCTDLSRGRRSEPIRGPDG